MSGRVDRRAAWRVTLGNVIYNNDTRAGRLFDLFLIFLILVSVLAVMLDSVSGFRARYGGLLDQVEWVLTLLFTVEYVLRLITARRAWNYARSFFGVVDLLSILPGYLALLLPGRSTSRSSGCCGCCASSASSSWCATSRRRASSPRRCGRASPRSSSFSRWCSPWSRSSAP